MYEWHGYGLFAMENVIIIYLSIVLDTELGESPFNISFLLIWDKNLGSHAGWLVAKPLDTSYPQPLSL